MQMGETERARLASKRLYELQPENSDAQYVYGRILHDAQRFQETLDPLARKMVAERPNDPHALFLLGRVDYDEANEAESRRGGISRLNNCTNNNGARSDTAMVDKSAGSHFDARQWCYEGAGSEPAQQAAPPR